MTCQEAPSGILTVPNTVLAIDLTIAPRPFLMAKRCLDVVVAVMALIVLAPLLLLIAALVRLDSKGPSLFRQDRVGLEGRLFTIWKFRTMHAGASEEPHQQLIDRLQTLGADGRAISADRPLRLNQPPQQKLTNDPRVTRIGRWLRRCSLDELPQLVNVLRGEMSIVGPRPLVVYEFDGLMDRHQERVWMLPGITGLCQVSKRNSLTYRRMCEVDLAYVHGWSLWLDIKILARTIPAVVREHANA